jgi:hypothetical protein
VGQVFEPRQCGVAACQGAEQRPRK